MQAGWLVGTVSTVQQYSRHHHCRHRRHHCRTLCRFQRLMHEEAPQHNIFYIFKVCALEL